MVGLRVRLAVWAQGNRMNGLVLGWLHSGLRVGVLTLGSWRKVNCHKLSRFQAFLRQEQSVFGGSGRYWLDQVDKHDFKG